jgi:hypothetical protein
MVTGKWTATHELSQDTTLWTGGELPSTSFSTRRGRRWDNMRKYTKPVAKPVTVSTVLALMA